MAEIIKLEACAVLLIRQSARNDSGGVAGERLPGVFEDVNTEEMVEKVGTTVSAMCLFCFSNANDVVIL